jgi:hypothetical protein
MRRAGTRAVLGSLDGIDETPRNRLLTERDAKIIDWR